jgi:prevent-host-death family protein
MKTMQAGEFKAKCLAVMADVNLTGKPVLITKRGKPLARIVPVEELRVQERPEDIFGSLKHLFAPPYSTIGPDEPFIPASDWNDFDKEWPVDESNDSAR